jgi:Outer membrane protein beta-barrel domain
MRNAALASVTVFVCATVFAFAAPLAAQTVEFGPRAGIAFSTVSVKPRTGPTNTEEGNVTGFTVGGFARFRPGKLGLQTELNFVRKGASVVTPNNPTDAMDLQLDYVEVPLLLMVPVVGGSSASASVYGGPALALETSCRGIMTGLPSRTHFNCSNPNFDVFDRRQTDIGATAGGTLRLPLGAGAIVADLRYTFGFVNLNKENGDKVRNRSTMVTLGYAVVR